MPTLPYRMRRGSAAFAATAAVAGVVALAATALPAQAAPSAHKLPKAGKNLLVNGDFAKPGPAAHEGKTPTGWRRVKLGAEKKPYSWGIGAYNAKGQYPPPAGNPNKADIADEVFYEAGSATGIEGIGGQQGYTRFGSITQLNKPQVSFSDVEHSAPEATNASWAGTGLEVNFVSHKKDYTLIYLDLWTAYKSTFKAKPVNSKTTRYILGPRLRPDVWHTTKPRSLNWDIKKQFGIKTYKVQNVIFVDLEHTINAKYPYANMDGYFANLSITEGK
jgi:hypothetical protein